MKVMTGLVTLIVSLIVAPAFAQKSKDTVRVGYFEPLKVVDQYFDSKQETAFLTDAVFDSLVYYDDRAGKFQPLLAKSWVRKSDTVLEFTLNEEARWHDGQPVTADDVIYTLDWLIDDKTKLRFKANYVWMKSVEKTSADTIRITGHEPFAIDLHRLRATDILPKHIHGKLANKETFGTSPVGSGTYKVVNFDRNTGATLERNNTYNIGGSYKTASNVKFFRTVYVPELQTQIAHLQTGGLDLLQGLPKDQAEALEADPRFTLTASRNLVYIFFQLDAAGRSGNAATTDPKVRRALFMAVDRNSIAQGIIAGGEQAIALDALCDPRQFGCVYTEKPPTYDPAAAQKLLAEAGYPNGLDLTIHTTTRARPTAEAVAGYLRRINVRANIQLASFTAYRKLQADGRFSALVHTWSGAGLPDVASTMSMFFSPGDRDYHGDERMLELTKIGESSVNDEERLKAYREAFNRINENSYDTVITTFPAVFLHTNDIEIRKGALNPFGADLSDISWR